MGRAVASLDLLHSVLLPPALPHWVRALRDLHYPERGPPGAQHSVQMAAAAGQAEAVAQRHQWAAG